MFKNQNECIPMEKKLDTVNLYKLICYYAVTKCFARFLHLTETTNNWGQNFIKTKPNIIILCTCNYSRERSLQ